MQTNQEQVKFLFGLCQVNDSSPKKDDSSKFNKYENIEENLVVPDILNEFADIVDTKVFEQPFSLHKYKNLYPKAKNKKKSPQKQSSKSTSLCKKESNNLSDNVNVCRPTVRKIQKRTPYKQKFRQDSLGQSDYNLTENHFRSPCSPTMSVDSAVDLSEDLNFPILTDDVELNNNQSSKLPDIQRRKLFPENITEKPLSTSSNFAHPPFPPCNDRITVASARRKCSLKVQQSFMSSLSVRNLFPKNNLNDSLKRKLPKEDKMIQISSKRKKLDCKHEKSLFDILCSDLSTGIPIHLIRSDDIENNSNRKGSRDNNKIDFQNNYEQIKSSPFNLSQNIQEESHNNDSSTSNYEIDTVAINFSNREPSIQEIKKVNHRLDNENFRETLVNLVCPKITNYSTDSSQAQECCIESRNVKDLVTEESHTETEITEKSVKSDKQKGICNPFECIILPDNTAVRTTQFIVDDDNENLPDSLIEIMGISEENRTDLSLQLHASNVKAPYNFHVNLLKVFSSGILRKDTKAKEKKKYKKNTRTETCAIKILKKYQKYRLKSQKTKTTTIVERSTFEDI